MAGTIRIVSLLQPPPEAVALFDELILIDSGRIMYAGPVDKIVGHFESLGYTLPDRTDVADWLLVSQELSIVIYHFDSSNAMRYPGTPYQRRGQVPFGRERQTPYHQRVQREVR